MPEIVLTEEQTRVLAGAGGPVTVRYPDGITVGVLDPRESEWVAEALRRRAAPVGPGSPAEDVRKRLAMLQAEWDRNGPFDAAYAREFIRRLRAGGADE